MGEDQDSGLPGWDDGSVFSDCTAIPPRVLKLLRNRPPRAPFEGFGGQFLRTYRVTLPGVALSPEQIFSRWMENFPATWPAGNHFIPCAPELTPGVTAAILLSMPLGMRIVTGARVIYRDSVSLTLVTLLGHMFAGLITFSVTTDGVDPVLQTQAFVSPGDPMYDLIFRLGMGQRGEDQFWHSAITSAAWLFGVQASAQQENRTISSQLQWRYFGNVWYNAGIRSFFNFYGRSFEKTLSRQQPGTA